MGLVLRQTLKNKDIKIYTILFLFLNIKKFSKILKLWSVNWNYMLVFLSQNWNAMQIFLRENRNALQMLLDFIIIRSHNNIKVRHDCKKFRFKYSLFWIYAPSGIHRDGVHTVSQTQKDCRVIYKRIENILQGQCHHKWSISIVNSSW